MTDSTTKESSRQKEGGFIIYRGGSIDDLQWDRFMAFFKYQVKHSLQSEGESWFYDQIDWKVINVPDEDEYDIRNRFNEWLNAGEEVQDSDNYRYLACIMVIEPFCEIVDEFMEGKSLEDERAVDEDDETFVMLVSRYEEQGEVLVSIRHLIPRAGDTVAMQGEGRGWQSLWLPMGEIATARTEMEKMYGPRF